MREESEKGRQSRPVKKIRLGGVTVSIWRERRRDRQGNEFDAFSASIDRSYRDADGQWRHAQQLRESDLPKAIVGLQQAYSYVLDAKYSQDESG